MKRKKTGKEEKLPTNNKKLEKPSTQPLPEIRTQPCPINVATFTKGAPIFLQYFSHFLYSFSHFLGSTLLILLMTDFSCKILPWFFSLGL